ncbi:MAG: uncharacterized protein PWR13_403 [Archaeoglobi archaeon]|nr:uncharacterized protein [Archaeoglobi archaeon]MDK2781375.1 uncharacterized protein [Archaeoglobi archaeon]
MWREILSKFSRYPAQEKVVRLLIQKGFGVNSRGRICVDDFEIPHSQIAEHLGVDRRVVDETAKKIISDESLRIIFSNLRVIPFLREVAPHLGLGVIVIEAEDPQSPGIVSGVSSVIASRGISIRQVVSDDPYFSENPRLTIITDARISPEIIEEVKKVRGVKGVTLY